MSKIKSAQMVFENQSQMVLTNGENPCGHPSRLEKEPKSVHLFKQED